MVTSAIRQCGRAFSNPPVLVVLRPSYEQTFSRAVSRAGKQLKASGPIRGLYGAFENLGALEKHVFDSTAHSVEATVEHVRTGARIGQFSL